MLRRCVINKATGKFLWGSPLKKSCLVSAWEATHCSNARALQTLFDTCAVRFGGDNSGYTETISCSKAAMTPTLPGKGCQ